MASKPSLASAFIASVVALSSFTTAQSTTDLPSLLRQTGAYVLDFERQLAGIVADEEYVQKAVPQPGKRRANLKRVELKSDLLMVKPADSDRYIAFRDVYEASGSSARLPPSEPEVARRALAERARSSAKALAERYISISISTATLAAVVALATRTTSGYSSGREVSINRHKPASRRPFQSPRNPDLHRLTQPAR